MHAHVPLLCAFRCRGGLQCSILCSFVAYRFEAVFTLRTGRMFCQAMEVLWKMRALGARDAGIPPFKTLT